MLVAADYVGIRDIFKIGGAQAIAALAFGTATVPQVHKIFGPGSIYVVAAKIWAASSGLPLAIDCPPGPSEILIIADDTAPAAFVAADLLSQAEHGEDSAAILLTPSARLAHAVEAAIAQQLPTLPTAARIHAALERYGMILVTEDLEACICFTNMYAPEHLEIMTADPWDRKPTHYECWVNLSWPIFPSDHGGLSLRHEPCDSDRRLRPYVLATVGGRVRKEVRNPGAHTPGSAEPATASAGIDYSRGVCSASTRCGRPFDVGKIHESGVSPSRSVSAACATRLVYASSAPEEYCVTSRWLSSCCC